MRYLCLVYLDESVVETQCDREEAVLAVECCEYLQQLKASGRHVASAELQPDHLAMTVLVRSGRTTVQDGPFTQTNGSLRALYLIEARDLNEAIQVAARMPYTRFGSIEVRPVAE